MRMLKVVVIGMGVLIVAATLVVIVTIANRWGADGTGSAGNPVTTPAPPVTLSAPYESEVTLPPGARILETSIGANRITLRLQLPDGTGALLLIDPATGKQAGMIGLK